NIGAASCAVPGAAAGLEAVHAMYGRLPWAELLQPAIDLARRGVEMSREQAHLHAILDLILRHSDEGRRVYSRRDGTRLVPGDLLIAYGLALLERVAAGRFGTAEAVVALAEVMREQTRVRAAGFTSSLHRGGLARRLLSDEGLATGLARIEAGAAGSSEPAP